MRMLPVFHATTASGRTHPAEAADCIETIVHHASQRTACSEDDMRLAMLMLLYQIQVRAAGYAYSLEAQVEKAAEALKRELGYLPPAPPVEPVTEPQPDDGSFDEAPDAAPPAEAA
jgi:hypothetical protein